MKPVEKLFNMIPQLDAVEFTGLARVLKVQLVKETNPEAEDPKERYEKRDFVSVLNDVLESFEGQNRARKREILSLVKEATKKARGERLAGRLQDLACGKDDSAPSTGDE